MSDARADAFARAARHIDAAACRDTLMAMVDIASPTGGEAELARYIVGRLAAAGMQAWLQEVEPGRPNAVGVLRGRGDGASLLFTGHMDTSYDGDESHLSAQGDGFAAHAVHRDGWIWGLGARNMKSGLASALVALEAIARENIALAGDLLYGGVVGETEKAPIDEFAGPQTSGYGIGSRYLVTHGVTADHAILCEPTQLRVCTANMGVLWVKLTVRGTVNHSALANRPGVVNAVDEAVALHASLKQWTERYQQAHEYMGERPSATIAAINGGLPWRASRNPFECSLYLDIRTVPGQLVDDVVRGLRQSVRAHAAARGSAEPQMQVYLSSPPTAVDHDSPFTRALAASARRVLGKEGQFIIRRPGADQVHFNRYDVPCLVYGPGGRMHPDVAGKVMHSVGEHVSVDDLVSAARVYLDLALSLCTEVKGAGA